MQTVREYAEQAAQETLENPGLYGVDRFDSADEFVDFQMDGDAGDACLVHKLYDAAEMRAALRDAYEARIDGEVFR